MPKSAKELNKEIDREYRTHRDVNQLITGAILGIFGGFAASLFGDIFIPNNKELELFYFVLSGGIVAWAIWYIDHRAYGRAYKLEKELKKLKKHRK